MTCTPPRNRQNNALPALKTERPPLSATQQPPLLRPATIDAFAAALREAAGAKNRVHIIGSGAAPLGVFDGDGRPIQPLSTLRINKLLEHAAGDMTVVVQAGITLDALQRELAWRNQWLPIDPPIVSIPSPGLPPRPPGSRTLAGLIASNSLGPLRFGSGDWRLFILGMNWIDAAGRILHAGGRTVKNVAGYASHRLLIGSFGSLGAIAQVALRTFALPPDETCVLFFCPSAAVAEDLLAAILLSPATPAYVQIVGGKTFRSNPLHLPAPTEPGAMILIAGFLGESPICNAQVELLRNLEPARKIEALSQSAAQAGRLRLWMTMEPGLAPEAPGAGFRIHARSSQSAAIVGAIEAESRKSAADDPPAQVWVVSEAGTGVVRGMLEGPSAAATIRGIAGQAKARLLWTQGPLNGASREDLTIRMKRSLDPERLFADPPQNAADMA